MTTLKKLTLLSCLLHAAAPLMLVADEAADQTTTTEQTASSTESNESGASDATSTGTTTADDEQSTALTTQAPEQAIGDFGVAYLFAAPAVAQNIKEAAYTRHRVAFARWGKHVIVDVTDYMNRTTRGTKYAKVKGQLVPEKAEKYVGTSEGASFCVRRGAGARSGVGGSLAKLTRSTARPEHMELVQFVDLYNRGIPMWLQVESATDLREFLNTVQDQLKTAAIDVTVRSAEKKPILLISIENDFDLESIDSILWSDLEGTYNVATMVDGELRNYFFAAKEERAKIITEGKESNNDTNDSFLEGLFNKVEKEYDGFSFKKITQKILADLVKPSHISTFVVTLVAAGVGVKLLELGKQGGEKLYGWWNPTKVAEGKAAERNKAAMAYVEAERIILAAKLRAHQACSGNLDAKNAAFHHGWADFVQ